MFIKAGGTEISMKIIGKILLLLLVTATFVLEAKEKKYDDNDIKRILYLKKPSAEASVRYVVLNNINGSQLECTYLGTQQNVTVNRKNVIPMIFYEDSSNFMITQYALYSMFIRKRPNLALGLAKINNDTTGRMTILSNFAASIKEMQSNISFIRQKMQPNSNDQANALADLISKDKTISIIKQAATTNDWFMAIALFDTYKEDIIQQYKRYFTNYPDVIKEAQIACTDCEHELLLNFANKIQQPNMRKAIFLQLYPQARGIWSQTPPTNYEQLKKIFIRSMTSYHNLDKISKIFKPQDWGSAMLDALLLLEGSACAAELEKEFDDEMRRLVKRSQRP